MGAFERIVEIYEGDITRLAMDAVVSASNQSLTPGAGVAKAIQDAAGKGLIDECRTIGGCPEGEARVTGAYNLPSKIVIHTVGPVWRGGTFDEEKSLARCYRESIRLARGYGAETIAFPAISTGKFGFPVDLAARIAVTTVAKEAVKHPPLRLVRMCCFGKESLNAYRAAMDSVRL